MHIFSADFLTLFLEENEGDNSIVLDRNGVLLDYGEKGYLQTRYPEAKVEQYRGVIMPALVNGHCHLELSSCGTVEKAKEAPFTDWIERLMQQRAEGDCQEEDLAAAAIEMAEDQYRSGVALLCDTGNNSLQGVLQKNHPLPLALIAMREIIAPTKRAFHQMRKGWQATDTAEHITPHAPYSVIPEALVAIKEHCRRNKHIFSIHTAETADEREFLEHSSGIFRQFLEKRGNWDGSFSKRSKYPSAIQYFDALGILDRETLLVHCTNLLPEDYAVIKKRKPAICLCPCSNDFLNVGKIDLHKLQEVAKGRICLGTDSVASNPSPDLWQEMARLNQYIQENNSKNQKGMKVGVTDILQMATINGIALLGKYKKRGRVGRGWVAPFIVVNSEQIALCSSRLEISKVLVSGGRPETIIHL